MHTWQDKCDYGPIPPETLDRLLECIPTQATAQALGALVGDRIIRCGNITVHNDEGGHCELHARDILLGADGRFESREHLRVAVPARPGYVTLIPEPESAPLVRNSPVASKRLAIQARLDDVPDDDFTLARLRRGAEGIEVDPAWWPDGITIRNDPRSHEALQRITELWPGSNAAADFTVLGRAAPRRTWADLLPELLSWLESVTPCLGDSVVGARRFAEADLVRRVLSVLTEHACFPASLGTSEGEIARRWLVRPAVTSRSDIAVEMDAGSHLVAWFPPEGSRAVRFQVTQGAQTSETLARAGCATHLGPVRQSGVVLISTTPEIDPALVRIAMYHRRSPEPTAREEPHRDHA